MPYPGLVHPEPLPLQQSTADLNLCRRHSNTVLSQSLWSLWVLGSVWALWTSLEGMGFVSKCNFAPPNILLSEKATATHSSTLAWKIPWTEKPDRLQFMGSRRVGHDWVTSFALHFHALEKEMATHSSVIAWRIPGTEEPSGLPSIGSHRVRHNWSNLAATVAAATSCCRAGQKGHSGFSVSCNRKTQMNFLASPII